MIVKMTAWIPGTRPGGAWPPPGGELEVSDAERAGLIASGQAVPVKRRRTSPTEHVASRSPIPEEPKR